MRLGVKSDDPRASAATIHDGVVYISGQVGQMNDKKEFYPDPSLN